MKILMVSAVAIVQQATCGEPMRWSQRFHERPLAIEACHDALKLSADGEDVVITWSNP